MTVTIALVIVLFMLFVWRKERTHFLSEYLFFVRIPLSLGILLLLLPAYGPDLAPDLLGNVFVLDRTGCAIVTFAALLAMWSIAFTTRLIWISTPARCMLFLSREEQRRLRATDSLRDEVEKLRPELLPAWTYVGLGILLTLTLVARLVRAATPGEALAGYGLGLVAAALVLLVARWFPWRGFARILLLPAARDMPPGLLRYHESAAWFFVVTASCYVAFFFAGNPLFFQWTSENLPALTYLYLLVMLVNWIFAAASFQLDNSRAPLLTVLLILIMCYQALVPGTHYYEVWRDADPEVEGTRESMPAIAALESSWENKGSPSAVAMVACSGGGIVASYWTAFVLEQLETDATSPFEEPPGVPRLRDFGDRVMLLSSVSGGGVGAMLYVDAFQEHRPAREVVSEMRRRAGATSLASVVWGLAYPDLARIALSPLLGVFDRGWAIERIWGRRLGSRDRSLGDWRPGVEAGWRPLLVFNATHQESGQRLLLAPASMGTSTERMRTSLRPGYDMRVTTAARLSATFPIILPQTRPSDPDAIQGAGYHVADGGYYDNSGLVTLLETLRDLVPRIDVRRVAIIEIRASPAYGTDDFGAPADDAPPTEEVDPFANVPPQEGGFVNNLIGPLHTLFNVRTSSQSARNRFEVDLFQNAASLEGVALEAFVFQLGPGQPLSWHLTETERGRIEACWPTRRDDVLEAVLQEAATGDAEAQRELVWLRLCRERNGAALARLREFLADG